MIHLLKHFSMDLTQHSMSVVIKSPRMNSFLVWLSSSEMDSIIWPCLTTPNMHRSWSQCLQTQSTCHAKRSALGLHKILMHKQWINLPKQQISISTLRIKQTFVIILVILQAQAIYKLKLGMSLFAIRFQ